VALVNIFLVLFKEDLIRVSKLHSRFALKKFVFVYFFDPLASALNSYLTGRNQNILLHHGSLQVPGFHRVNEPYRIRNSGSLSSLQIIVALNANKNLRCFINQFKQEFTVFTSRKAGIFLFKEFCSFFQRQ
jgi:hypothetical protein